MESVQGYIDHIVFQNTDNGYTVLLLITEDREELICVGTFHGTDAGMSIRAEGAYTEHPVYGRQFKVSSYREIMPDDTVSIERYLGSGAIKGIGPTMAARIVARFGKDTFAVMENEPERLSEIKGISEKKAQEIASIVYEKRAMREAFLFMQQYAISNTLAVKIYERYGDGVYKVIRENPYRLAEDIEGVGFKTADEIASKLGIEVDSEYRIRSGLLYCLLLAAGEGHTYLPVEMLKERCCELLEIPAQDLTPELQNLAMDKKVVIKNDRVYAQAYYYAESSCASMLTDLNISLPEEEFAREEDKIRSTLKRIMKKQDIELDALQEKAVFECIRHGVLVISGGPGTGKTTTINTIIRYFDADGMDILLAAPTGRAAKRMQETTGYEAKTIHRLLEVNGGKTESENGGMFERNEENPLEADVIIIDEMSMVDIFLFRALLRAVSIGTRLILVGDVDQLPSVGPGQVLRDVIDSGAFEVVMLKKIFRQAGESDIVVNAHRINEGKDIPLDNKSSDFFFLERNDANVIYKHMIQLIRDKLPGYVEADSYDIQVITPTRKGLLGAPALNGILQEYLNPASSGKRELRIGERLFREGDKVMQIKNNYQLTWKVVSKYNIAIDEGSGVFNGDTGIIREIDPVSQTVYVLYDENKTVEYSFSTLDELELAYAVTVHKSQGSEYPAVVMPVLSGPRMLLNRNLLYTAVTRAKKCVTILGSSEVLKQMIANDRIYERYSSLAERIREVNGIRAEG